MGTPAAAPGRRPRPFPHCFVPGSPFLGNSRFPAWLPGRGLMRSAAFTCRRSRRRAAGKEAHGLRRSGPQAGGGHPLIVLPGLAPEPAWAPETLHWASPRAGAEYASAGARGRGPWGEGAPRRQQLPPASVLCSEAPGQAGVVCKGSWATSSTHPPRPRAPSSHPARSVRCEGSFKLSSAKS